MLHRDRNVDQRFLTEGRLTTGKVLIKSRSTDSHTYYASYVYQLPNGHKCYGAARLPLQQWEALTELGPLSVRYLTTADDRSRPDGAIENPMLGPAFATTGGLLTLIGLYLLLRK